jgi:hypothetical protein
MELAPAVELPAPGEGAAATEFLGRPSKKTLEIAIAAMATKVVAVFIGFLRKWQCRI